jgi:osmotically-inducible protein OsmY
MTKSALKSDAELQRAVLRELAWDSRVKATEIGVVVDRGVVTLTGTVGFYGKKVAAAEAAHRVRGVLDVANDIVVGRPAGVVWSDAEIARAVRNVLSWNFLVPDDRIATTVTDGVVTLEGEVDTAFERREAERLVEPLAGVRAVFNHITVKPAPIEPDRVRHAIEDALERRAERIADRIGVEVRDGLVVLTGHVRSWREKRAVLGAVSHATGVLAVDDELTIDPSL